MRIYTKTGDKGKTSLISGKTISKSEPIIEVLGSLDELNALIGLSCSYGMPQGISNILINIQGDLFFAGSLLANTKSALKSYNRFKDSTENLEKEIDKLNIKLPLLKNFILPGGSEEAAKMHYCRVMCRRAERNLVTHIKKTKNNKIYPLEMYINRLSDFFFVAARYINYKKNYKDIIWKG